jgi:hypothetical protein
MPTAVQLDDEFSAWFAYTFDPLPSLPQLKYTIGGGVILIWFANNIFIQAFILLPPFVYAEWGKAGKGVRQFQPGSPSSIARIIFVSSSEKTHSSTTISSGIL